MLRSASRWVIRHSMSALDREEKGFVPDASPTSQPSQPAPIYTITTTDENNLIPQRDKLLVFRSLTGIDTVPTVSRAGHSSRAGPNLGIYPRVIKAERKAGRAFTIYNLVVNICLGTQIVVAAALTALGAADGSRGAVTAFGAINTIIAGFLTYLKGSGMPQRLKTIQDEFKTVREFVEQREREFCLADCPLDPVVEAAVVDDMYQVAKQELESGGSNNKGGGSKGGLGGVGGARGLGGSHGFQRAGATLSAALGQRLSKLSESSGATKVGGGEKSAQDGERCGECDRRF